MTDKQRPRIVFHKPPSDSANPHGMRRPIIPLKSKARPTITPSGVRPTIERPTLPTTTDSDPTPPMGTERPIIKLSDADKNAKPEPKVTSFKKDRPIIKLKED